jgi:hypothetical protein
VLDARLSRSGAPLVTLSTARAYAWSEALQAWACVADDSLAASHYMPLLSLAGQGEAGAGGQRAPMARLADVLTSARQCVNTRSLC